MQILYKILDIFFLVFHSIITLFNMVGWISVKTRKVHFFTMYDYPQLKNKIIKIFANRKNQKTTIFNLKKAKL